MDGSTYYKTTWAGLILMIAGFIFYAAAPAVPFIALFVVGLAVMVASYYMLYKEGKDLQNRLETVRGSQDSDGYIMCLDGTYAPENDDATIETLE